MGLTKGEGVAQGTQLLFEYRCVAWRANYQGLLKGPLLHLGILENWISEQNLMAQCEALELNVSLILSLQNATFFKNWWFQVNVQVVRNWKFWNEILGNIQEGVKGGF